MLTSDFIKLYFSTTVRDAVVAYNNDYNAKYYDENLGRLSADTCGNAVTLIKFGRKRKLKALFQEAGVLGFDWSDKGISVDTNDLPRIPTQNLSYYEGRARVVRNAILGLFVAFDIDLEVFNHSWVD